MFLMYRYPFIRWLRWENCASHSPAIDKNVEGLLLSFPELMCKPVAGYTTDYVVLGEKKKSRCRAKYEFSAIVVLFLIFCQKSVVRTCCFGKY